MSRWAEFGYPNTRLGSSFLLGEGMRQALAERVYAYDAPPAISRLDPLRRYALPLFCDYEYLSRYPSRNPFLGYWRQKAGSGGPRTEDTLCWSLSGLCEELHACLGLGDASSGRLTQMLPAQERYMSYVAANWLRYKINSAAGPWSRTTVGSTLQEAWEKQQEEEGDWYSQSSNCVGLSWNHQQGYSAYITLTVWEAPGGHFTTSDPSGQVAGAAWWDMGTGLAMDAETTYSGPGRTIGDYSLGIGTEALSLPFPSLPISGETGFAGMCLPWMEEEEPYSTAYFRDLSPRFEFFDDCDHLLGRYSI